LPRRCSIAFISFQKSNNIPHPGNPVGNQAAEYHQYFMILSYKYVFSFLILLNNYYKLSHKNPGRHANNPLQTAGIIINHQT